MIGDVAVVRNACATFVSDEENIIVVSIGEYHKPTAISFIAKPMINQSEDVSLWVMASGKFDFGSNISISLLKPSGSACMHPKYPGLRLYLANSVGIFDRNLGLVKSDISMSSVRDNLLYRNGYPIPPKPTRASRAWFCDASCPRFFPISARTSSRPTNALSLWNGIIIDGLGNAEIRPHIGISAL
jgi:hypothetical protein